MVPPQNETGAQGAVLYKATPAGPLWDSDAMLAKRLSSPCR